MKTKGIGTLLFLMLIMTISSIAYGDMKVQKNGYEISLPDGWIEIPSDVIEKYENMLSDLAPNSEKQHYDCGFQLGSKKNWLDYPYILIQVKNIGRIPESQLKKLQGFSMQKTIDDQKDNFNSVMSDIQTGKMIYDNQNKMIWMRFEANVHDVGPIIGISGMILTEKGFIQANAYSIKDEYANYEPVFRTIATSVTPVHELTYKPKWSDDIPVTVTGIDWGKVAGKAVVGAIIGGIIALIAGIRRKKNNQ